MVKKKRFEFLFSVYKVFFSSWTLQYNTFIFSGQFWIHYLSNTLAFLKQSKKYILRKLNNNNWFKINKALTIQMFSLETNMKECLLNFFLCTWRNYFIFLGEIFYIWIVVFLGVPLLFFFEEEWDGEDFIDLNALWSKKNMYICI